jgi:dTDP-4-amino-4,6-dideoxygalactose transaminase
MRSGNRPAVAAEYPANMSKPISAPTYPVRRSAVIAAAIERLEKHDWTRLEGEPETEAALAAWHGRGITGTDPEVWYVASGTAALEAIMLGHEIGPGDEVVVTPYTWGATVSAILAIGAIPVFADVDPLTGLLDPVAAEAAITPRTRAIMCVHLFGTPCDGTRLRELADRRGVLLFEDGSQAHGARWRGTRVGAFGHAAAFSCMGLKLLAGTEGGYAVFHDQKAAERAYLYGKHPRGLRPERAAHLAEEGLLDALQLGWRPCTVGAALVRHALPHLDEEIAARRRHAAVLRARLGSTAHVTMPPEPEGATACWHLLSLVFHPEHAGCDLETYRSRLEQRGVGTFRYIPVPIHRLKRLNPHEYNGPRVFWHEQLQRAGVDYRQTSCPHAEWRAAREFTMGFNWTGDDPEAMERLGDALIAAATT